MDDLGNRVFYWLTDETNVTVLMFTAATLLGVASLLLFFLSGQGSATQTEFVLLVAAMILVFFVTIRSSTF